MSSSIEKSQKSIDLGAGVQTATTCLKLDVSETTAVGGLHHADPTRMWHFSSGTSNAPRRSSRIAQQTQHAADEEMEDGGEVTSPHVVGKWGEFLPQRTRAEVSPACVFCIVTFLRRSTATHPGCDCLRTLPLYALSKGLRVPPPVSNRVASAQASYFARFLGGPLFARKMPC